MTSLVDLRNGFHGTQPVPSDRLVFELATCLERFLDATADDMTLDRARRALDVWRTAQAESGLSG